jgi:hypothetical protein
MEYWPKLDIVAFKVAEGMFHVLLVLVFLRDLLFVELMVTNIGAFHQSIH